MELANYQLLRYRVLDKLIDERLKKITKLVEPKKRGFSLASTKALREEFREIIKVRTESVNQFEAVERDIKLIGDWYLARLYDLLTKKFRLESWRQAVKEKLDSLEDIYSVAAENLGFSLNQRLEILQIWGFFILQIGWFVLIILELQTFIE